MTRPPGGDAPGTEDGSIPALVEHLFRRCASRHVASLARALGAANLHLAEESVQDALVRALRTWPYGGVPTDPEAWLFRVARNRALDRLRRAKRWEVHVPPGSMAALTESVRSAPVPERLATGSHETLADDELAMIFMCCHPGLSPESRVALTLRTVGGLGVSEIAAAFLVPPATVAQRIVRAKRTIRERALALEIPGPSGLPERMDSVLQVLYLLFNEGYAAHGGEELIREELCGEAIRLARILVRHPDTGSPRVEAILALFLLQGSRLPARTDEEGGLLLLPEQDRRLWDRHLIQEGLVHLDRAGGGEALSPYHIEAGIAAVHAVSVSFESTDWARILAYYDLLRKTAPSPVVELNRAVALAMVAGSSAGLAALEPLEEAREMRAYHLLPATRGMLLERAGERSEAAVSFRRALMLASSAPTRRFLERRLRELEDDAPPT